MPLRVATLVLFSLLALAGCGAVSSQDASSQSDTETPAPQDTLLAPTATITANQVTVTTDRSTYTPGDSVRVTIANGRGASIYAIASKANCTALDVHVKTVSGWQAANMASCASQVVPDTIEIKPGSATTVTITAPSAGTYRCALQYTTINIPPPRGAPNGAIVSAANSASGPAAMVYSTEWEVKSA
jgi:hypothetical protein